MFKKALVVATLFAAQFAHAGIISDYNKTTATNAGWTVVYQGGYGSYFNYSNVLASIAAGSTVALASSSSGSAADFDLFAATSLSNLLTTTAINTTFFADGAYWYRNSYSLGFAPNQFISQNSADTVGVGWGNYDYLQDGDFRLSWHTGSNNGVSGGWRSGLNTWLNGDNTWQRYVLVQAAPTQSVDAPASLATLGLGLLVMAGLRRKKSA